MRLPEGNAVAGALWGSCRAKAKAMRNPGDMQGEPRLGEGLSQEEDIELSSNNRAAVSGVTVPQGSPKDLEGAIQKIPQLNCSWGRTHRARDSPEWAVTSS